jgi:RHS repeat-associated protein
VVTDYSGAIRQNCTNLPYGDGLTCTSAGITPTHFTGYTRDTESNLDFANARYYTSQFGRFMSVDPLGGSVSDPQSLNAYAYVGNGPLSATDSSGMSIDSPTTYGIDMPIVFNAGSGFSSGSQFQLPSFGPLSFSGVSFGGRFPGSNSGFGDSPGPGSLGLCGVIAGCGGSFDAAPPGPSHGQLQQKQHLTAHLVPEVLSPCPSRSAILLTHTAILFANGSWTRREPTLPKEQATLCRLALPASLIRLRVRTL